MNQNYLRRFRGRLGLLTALVLCALPVTPSLLSESLSTQPAKAATGAAAVAPQTPTGTHEEADHYVNIPYFTESAGMTSTLTLNNNRPEEMTASVTLFNSRGEQLALEPITLQPQTAKRFSVKKLAADARGDFSSGNIQVFFRGGSMDITSQVSIVSTAHSLSFESVEAAALDSGSAKLDGIVWAPDAQTQARVALTNTTFTAIGVTVSSGRKSRPVTLGGRETKVIDLREFLAGKAPDAALVTIEHTGALGALAATGFVFNEAKGFSSNLNFVDCSTVRSNRLAGAHVRLGQAAAREGFPSGTFFRAPLVLANTTDSPADASVSVDYTVNSAAQRVELGQATLGPGEVRQIDLAQELAGRGVSGPVEDAGVDISYSGMQGSVIGRLTSIDASGDYSFDVPVKDPLSGGNAGTGNYPWRLDGDYTTVLHLKNTLDKEVRAIVQVRYEGGTYNPELIKLAPYQTVAIDIRQLRDAQQNDVRGGVMPKGVTSGQVIWYEQEKGSLIGRAEIFNARAGVASSFSCGSNCCGTWMANSYLTRTSIAGGIGEGCAVDVMKRDTDCNNIIYGPYSMGGSSTWASTNTAVATMSGQWVSLVGEGNCGITATFNTIVGYAYSCTPVYSNVTNGGGVTVNPTITISSVSFQSPTIARQNGSDKLLIQLSASPGVPTGTTVSLEAFQNTNANGSDLSITGPGGSTDGTASNITIVPNSVNPVEFTLKTPFTAPTAAGFVTYRVRLTAVTPGPSSPTPTISLEPAAGVISSGLCVGTLSGTPPNQTCS